MDENDFKYIIKQKNINTIFFVLISFTLGFAIGFILCKQGII